MAEPFAPSSERFDEVFTDVAAGRVANELFDQVMGPFPSQVEPFSLVTREGLYRVLVPHVSPARPTRVPLSRPSIREEQRRASLNLPESGPWGRARPARSASL